MFYPILGLLIMASCKDNEITTTVSSPLYAEVNSVVQCNFDVTNDTNQFGRYEIQPEFVPSGTKLHFTVSGKDLQVNPVPGYNYQDVVVTEVVGANGKIKASVPVGSNSTNISVGGDEFEANYTYTDFNRANELEKLVSKEIFSLKPITVSLKSGFVIVQPLKYSKK